MGKRSDFKRIPRDFYPTPMAAVVPLIPHLPDPLIYWEPCAGDATLVDHLANSGRMTNYMAHDIEPQGDGVIRGNSLTLDCPNFVDLIITNPPWDRKILHPMIAHFSAMRPTWLLFDADWMHTKQSASFMPYLRKIVSVGRVKWIPDSKMTGKDNCAWYLFDQNGEGATQFYGRTA
jgi:hypothetical protein